MFQQIPKDLRSKLRAAKSFQAAADFIVAGLSGKNPKLTYHLVFYYTMAYGSHEADLYLRQVLQNKVQGTTDDLKVIGKALGKLINENKAVKSVQVNLYHRNYAAGKER